MMPMITIPIPIPVLPLYLALLGVSIVFGAGIAMLIQFAQDRPLSLGGQRAIGITITAGSILALSALIAVMITYPPWDAS